MSHPAIGARCLMRRWRVLSGLHWCRIGRPDKAFTPYPDAVPDATLPRLIGPTKFWNRRPDKAFTPHPASG
ncbi:hypothetical protein DMI70_00665 [Escherichia coli]|nr:hypothetical protein [Escherichia coli]